MTTYAGNERVVDTDVAIEGGAASPLPPATAFDEQADVRTMFRDLSRRIEYYGQAAAASQRNFELRISRLEELKQYSSPADLDAASKAAEAEAAKAAAIAADAAKKAAVAAEAARKANASKDGTTGGTIPPTNVVSNTTTEYTTAAFQMGLALMANPDLRRGYGQLLPLVPAALSLADNGANRDSVKEAVLPLLFGGGAILAARAFR